MIELTRLSRQRFYLNSALIETVESTPDTVIRLTNGQSFIVREPAIEVQRRVVEFHRTILGKQEGAQLLLGGAPKNHAAE